jgi:hypothetical protein
VFTYEPVVRLNYDKLEKLSVEQVSRRTAPNRDTPSRPAFHPASRALTPFLPPTAHHQDLPAVPPSISPHSFTPILAVSLMPWLEQAIFYVVVTNEADSMGPKRPKLNGIGLT